MHELRLQVLLRVRDIENKEKGAFQPLFHLLMNSRKTFAFIRHWLRASTKHDVHSPFVFEFVTKVLPAKQSLKGAEIDALRSKSLSDSRILEIEDFGAGYGGKEAKSIQKTLAQVAKSSARGRREGELLGRIVTWLKPRQVLELGTNLGFSAAYIASSLDSASQFISIEGSTAILEVAKGNLADLGLGVELRQGEFDKVLPTLDWASFQPDFVLIDGNHRYQPTMHYFQFLLERTARPACIIFDDIHWSEEMERAWSEIIEHPEVDVSLDLFEMGLIFIGRSQAKQHFRFRFRSW